MAEADEFDRVMQSVSEGSYRPSTSSSMETFPVSHVLDCTLHIVRNFMGLKTWLYTICSTLTPHFTTNVYC